MADDKTPKPIDDDVRHDDLEYNPQLEPKNAKAWLNLLIESEDAFKDWNDHCDKIDERFASLSRLSHMTRDKEFQMFWANAEVLKPSIYAKPPRPVVVPKFKDRRPVYQAASEMAERCVEVAFDLSDINDLMILIRDDLTLASRGVAWCRYESKGVGYGYEKICIDFKNRRDFLHSLSRNWREVTWVAGASYLTRAQARKRFRKHSGDAYQQAEYRVNKDAQEVGGADNRERAKFWEVWDKANERVLWVAHGCEKILDEDDPHLELRNFFPCPKPCYGTVQRGSLIPVPDILQYRDQLEEINLLTGRIHALSDALEAKGFYPAGGAELSDAIQTAISMKTPGRLLVPINNWAAFGGSKEVIIWLPVEQIANTVTALVALRKQVIEDIYQIMGLSDIMRGATDPGETLGAQQLKTQYGSTRIRDKQQELVRMSRDLVEISLEIMTAEFDDVTMIEMSQTMLPTQQMQRKQVMDIQQDIRNKQLAFQKAQQLPQAQQMMQQNPQQAQQMIQQGQQALQQAQEGAENAIKKIMSKPSIDQVLHFLRDNKAKAFVLDIETDSTIMQDEQMEKQQRTEFISVLANLMPQLSQMIMSEPKTAEFAGELLKFATAPFRAGRSLDGSIDELVEQMKAKGDMPKSDDPLTAKTKADAQTEMQKLQYQREKDKSELDLKNKEMEQKDRHKALELQSNEKVEMLKMKAKTEDDALRAQTVNQKQMADREKHQADMVKKSADMEAAQLKGELAKEQMLLKRDDMQAKQQERKAMAQFKQEDMIAKRGITDGFA